MTDATDKVIDDLTATFEYEVQNTVKIRTMGPSHCSALCPQLEAPNGHVSRCRLDNKVLSPRQYLIERSAYCHQLVREQHARRLEVK